MQGVLGVVESHVGFSVALFLLLFLTHQLRGERKRREGEGGREGGGVGKRGREREGEEKGGEVHYLFTSDQLNWGL